MKEKEILEKFYMKRMSPSDIDKQCMVEPGTAHDVIVGHWKEIFEREKEAERAHRQRKPKPVA